MTSPTHPTRYLVATDDGGSQHYVRCLQEGTALAASAGADLVLFDRSSESYLVDPYPVGAFADDEDELGATATLDRRRSACSAARTWRRKSRRHAPQG